VSIKTQGQYIECCPCFVRRVAYEAINSLHGVAKVCAESLGTPCRDLVNFVHRVGGVFLESLSRCKYLKDKS
ncbi:hypothetical protein MWN41_14200, partial [Ornithobacterium rhinotracheale]|uniref:hypothetical protein n=1 Tax=Ornithobacterium rhinotracheale TaxID=28251 RepID=UPI001FF1FC51